MVLGSRDSRVGRHMPEEFSLEEAPALRKHPGPCGERCPTSSRHTGAFEAEPWSRLSRAESELLGHLTHSANQEQTNQGTRSDLPESTWQVSSRSRMGPTGLSTSQSRASHHITRGLVRPSPEQRLNAPPAARHLLGPTRGYTVGTSLMGGALHGSCSVVCDHSG